MRADFDMYPVIFPPDTEAPPFDLGYRDLSAALGVERFFGPIFASLFYNFQTNFPFTYRGDSLGWFTELYLQRMRRLEAATATVVALGAACDQLRPASLTVETDDLVIRDAAHTFGRTRGVSVDTRGGPV